MWMFSAEPSYQMTQFIFMARTHEHIHINAVIWSIEQAHQLHQKPHDVCSQRLSQFIQSRHYSWSLYIPFILSLNVVTLLTQFCKHITHLFWRYMEKHLHSYTHYIWAAGNKIVVAEVDIQMCCNKKVDLQKRYINCKIGKHATWELLLCDFFMPIQRSM